MTSPLDPAPPTQSEPQRITQPMQVAGLLRRMQDAHALVHVSVPGNSEFWLSAILEIHANQGYLLIDELTPRDGNAVLRNAGRVVVSAQIQGVDIGFASNMLGSGVSDGLGYFRLALPESVNYWQRRSSYRVRVGAATVIPVVLGDAEALSLEGELYDISVGGIGTRHRHHKGPTPLLGEIWRDCRILLPEGQEVRCALELRYVDQSGKSSHLRLGGRFVDITRPQLRHIETFVRQLERENLRKVQRTRK